MICSMLQITEYGLIAGIAMTIIAITMNISGFTKLNFTQYLGYLAIGHTSGALSFTFGIVLRLIWSIIFAYIYIYALDYFAFPITLQTALIFTMANMLFSELILHSTDAINPGVASGKIQAAHFFAYHYGISGVITYLISHLTYAIVLFSLLGAPLK